MSFPAPTHEPVLESSVDPDQATVAVASSAPALEATASRARGRWEWHGLTARGIGLLSLIAAAVIWGRLALETTSFPAEDLRISVGSRLESATNWFVENMVWFYDPIATTLASGLEQLNARLALAPAPQIAALLVVLVFCARGVPLALLTAVSLTWCVATGVWEETLQTLAFMLIAVAISCVLGISLGIVGSLGRRLEAVLRAVLDGMQAFPIFAYLVPVVLIFGPGDVGAMVVTIVWATPPVARMTIVGLKGVPEEIIESAQSFGVNRWQLLLGVRLPLARTSIYAGINQTIMFAISMATLSAIIGGSGLGQVAWGGLTRLDFGDAVAGGLALVLFAVILDRATAPRAAANRRSVKSADRTGSGGAGQYKQRVAEFVRHHPRGAAGALLALVAMIITTAVPSIRLANFNEPPEWLALDVRVAMEHAITWTTVNLGPALDSIRTNVSLYGINPVLDVLRWIPWPAMVLLGLVAGYVLIGIRAAVLVGGGIYLIGAMGMWEATIVTVAVVSVSVAIAVIIGFPIGVAMSRSDRLSATIRPVLDLVQTLPIFLFVIPAVIFMGTGQVTGAMATVGFALPPIIRLTNVALRNADAEVVEAARSFGATERQILVNVRAPLGLPTILVGLNQTVLLALAMAVVAAFVGTPGLGEEILVAINGGFFGPGVEAGLSMFILVLIFDRLFRAWTTRLSFGAHLKVR